VVVKVLVTGGAGFIGTNLVLALRARGDDVMILDDLSSGSMENLTASGGKWLIGPSLSIGFFRHFSPDLIFHLGIPSSSPMYLENRWLVGSVLTEATAVFDYAVQKRVKVVFASSSSLYNGKRTPQRENMVPLVKDFYTEARYGVERLAQLYHDLYGLEYAAMRFFSVYGPHEEAKGKYANLATQFAMEAKRGDPVVMRGDGTPERDFVHVEDVVQALLRAAHSDSTGIFNVGTGTATSLNRVVGTIGEILGREIEIVHLPETGFFPIAPDMPEIGKNYIQATQASTRKAEIQIGFRAFIMLEEGLRRMLA